MTRDAIARSGNLPASEAAVIAHFHRPIAPAGWLAGHLLAERGGDARGLFGDRDAGPVAGPRPLAPGCGLFGRRSDASPIIPSNGPLGPARIVGEAIRRPRLIAVSPSVYAARV